MSRITFNSAQCCGRPSIRGMRIRVKDVLELLASGVSEAEVLTDYLYLEQEDIRIGLFRCGNGTDVIVTGSSAPIMS